MKADARLGLPAASTLENYQIWDAYFTPGHSHPGADGTRRLYADIQRSGRAIELGHIQKLCYFAHVGIGTTRDAALEKNLQQNPDWVTAPLRRWPEMLIGMIQLNAHNVRGSRDAIDRWVRDGPMVGVYFPGGGPAAMCCTDPSFDKLIPRLHDVGAVIIQHTWFKTGGKQSPGESTPAELATVAQRYPEQKFVCAHAGGQWQTGIRAVRAHANVLIETSGFDATAGFIEMAVRELGSRRILFGSHLPSRSLGTELAKVIGANVRDQDKQRILGENLRQLLQS